MFRFLLSSGFLVASGAGKAVFLVIDTQDCFLEANTTSGEAGSLAVPASQIIPLINSIRAEKSCLFEEVIFTQDYHPAGHISFGSTHGLAPFSHLAGKGSLPLKCISPESGLTKDGACCPGYYIDSSAYNCSEVLCPPDGWDYDVNMSAIVANNPACTTCAETPEACFDMVQAMWTDHCLQSGDSTFPPSLDKTDTDLVVQKGTNLFVDAYSAFADNTKSLKTQLDDVMAGKGIDTLYVAGIATDVCVHATVIDALSDLTSNYTVYVIKDASAAVQGSQTNFDASVEAMKDAGATILQTADVLAMDCPATTNDTATEVESSGASQVSALFTASMAAMAALTY